MTELFDTTGREVVTALAAERRSAGGVASGLALTLVAVAAEDQVRDAEAAATIAASAHPCRLLIVVRADVEREQSRLDAEVVVGGRLGPGEAVVMRMYGRLALHAESVVMPLLAPDVPVVTWWQMAPPERIAHDFLGVFADRRVTDAARAADPVAALRGRADDYAPGDTDLAWTRITPWRTLIAGAFDSEPGRVATATVVAPATDPTAALMVGWLGARLGVTPRWTVTAEFPRMRSVTLEGDDGERLELVRTGDTALFRRTGQPDRTLPLVRRPVGDELAEELRRLDADQVYSAALGTFAGQTDLDGRPRRRIHIWRDPALAAADEAADDAAVARMVARDAAAAQVRDAARAHNRGARDRDAAQTQDPAPVRDGFTGEGRR